MTSSPSSSEAEVKDQDGDNNNNNGDETDIDEILRRGFVAEEEYRPKPGFNVGRLSPNIMVKVCYAVIAKSSSLGMLSKMHSCLVCLFGNRETLFYYIRIL